MTLFSRAKAMGFLLILASSASAQSVTLFDPGSVPFQPKQTLLKKCGVSLAVDPRWSKNEKAKSDGGYEYHFFVSSDFWKSRGSRANDFVNEAYAEIRLNCANTKLKDTDDALVLFVEGYRKRLLAVPGIDKTTKPKSIKLAGVGAARYFTYTSKSSNQKLWRASFDQLQLVTLHNGKLIRLSARIDKKPSTDHLTRHRAGKTLTLGEGTEKGAVTIKLARSTEQHILTGLLKGVRTQKENHALFSKVLSSLKGH